MNTQNIKVSIITVVYNAASTIEATLLSVLNQSYTNIEYIVIDGASKDGTVDIIKKYADRISAFVTGPDDGIFDAMNKGIELASGNLVNFMNSGDVFYDSNVVGDIISAWEAKNGPDLIYGNSWIKHLSGSLERMPAGRNPDDLKKGPIFRHGAMFVNSNLQKQYPFKTGKKYNVCADFDFIYHMYVLGKRMVFEDRDVLMYSDGGVSSNKLECASYNGMIVMHYTPKVKYRLFFAINYLFVWLKSGIEKNRLIYAAALFFTRFIWHYLPNYVIAFVPLYFIRHGYYRIVCRIKIGKSASVHMRTYIMGRRIRIGRNSVINHSCMLDGRDFLYIGENVSISPYVHIITASHSVNSPSFDYIAKQVEIEDYVWIGSRATILPGVKVGKGAVVAVGAVVTKNVEPYTIVAGVPAQKIGDRTKNLHYNTAWAPFFD